jgi:predicted anti-sigma-YlaC factor YlaD
MMNCKEATRLLSESQDHTLSIKERISLKLHVSMCKGCRNFGHQMQYLRKITRAYAERKDTINDD